MSRQFVIALITCLLQVAVWPASALVAQEKVHDRIYVPTPQPIVEKMLELAIVTDKDMVYDIGCGDGRTLVTAAKKYDCKAKGFEMLPKLVEEAKKNIAKEKLETRATVELVKALDFVDVSGATVVTAYILPERVDRLAKQVGKLKPGVRFVFHDYCFSDYVPDKVIEVKRPERTHNLYLFTTPLKKKK